MKKITSVLGDIRHSKFFIRVFFSVILIALIVAFVFSSIIYTRFISQQRKDKLLSLENDVKTVSQNFNKRIEDMLRIVINIDSNYEFFSYPLNNIEMQRDVMVSELNKYTIGNRFIRDIGYYRISEPQFIYSNLGKMDIDMFFKHIYRFKDITGDKFKNMIKRKNMKVIPVEDANFTTAPAQIITFVFGLPFAIPEPSRNVIFFVNKIQLDDIVNDVMGDTQDNLYIFDENNTPIYSFKENNQLEAAKKLLTNKDENSIYTNTQNGTEYLYLKNVSDYSGWTLVTVYKTKKVLYDYYFNRNFLLIVVLLIFLIIITSAVLIAFYNYKPLYKLMEKISGNSNNPHSNYDEIEYIEEIVENEINKKKLLQKQLFLSNLIWGQFEDSNSLSMSMMEANILFNYKNYVACCIYYSAEHNDTENTNSTTQVDTIMSAIERIFDLSDTQAMCVDLNDKSSIAVVINYQGEGADRKKISGIFKELTDDALLNYNTNISVGVGNECKNALQIEQSYQQAWQAVFFSILNDEEYAVYEYNDECAKIDLPNYFKMIITRAINQGNKEMVMNKISQQVDQLYQEYKNNKSIKNIYYHVFEYLTNLCYKLNLDADDDVIRNCKRILSNPTYSTEQIYQSMEQLCLIMCSSAQATAKVNKNTELKEKILAIIHDNLCDNTLSLEKIADECNVTPSYLVRYFRAQTGHSPMQYVDMKRMDHAKTLLATTDYNLKQIVTQTGYIDESNFIRKFKKIEQITPIKYRKNYQV